MEFDRGDRLKGVTTLIDLYLWLRPRRFVFLSVHLGLTNRAVKCSEEEREKKLVSFPFFEGKKESERVDGLIPTYKSRVTGKEDRKRENFSLFLSLFFVSLN